MKFTFNGKKYRWNLEKFNQNTGAIQCAAFIGGLSVLINWALFYMVANM